MSELKNNLYPTLVRQIESVVQQARSHVSHTVNHTLILTNWSIGKHIVEYEQHGDKRATYGKQLLLKLSTDLTQLLGRGYSHRNLKLFRQFYLTYPIGQSLIAQSQINENIKGQSLIAQFKDPEKLPNFFKLSWTHLVRLMSIKDEVERQFYMHEAYEGNWSVRVLNRQIDAALYERTKLSGREIEPSEGDRTGEIPLALIKDPYILEFLGLKEDYSYSESELENAIIDNLEKFLLELGKGFSFVSRQYRISSQADHFYIDLVFYNRLLQCHVLIDLKIGKLKHQDIGQMQMYVNYFDREIKADYEKPTIGIILCKEKNDFVVEYSLPKDNQQIYSKEYLLYLPDKKELKQLLKKYL